MASNPLNTRFFWQFIGFPMNFAIAPLGLKEIGKFLWECREKSLPSWLSQFSCGKCKEKPGIPFWGWTPFRFS